MNVHVCAYCGESLSPLGNTLSRHPLLCASCSSIADGMDEPCSSQAADLEPERVTLDEEEGALCGAS